MLNIYCFHEGICNMKALCEQPVHNERKIHQESFEVLAN